jgi:hypothetical protein
LLSIAAMAQRKICRHDDHEQKHGTHRPKKKTERRLRNNSSTAFSRFCHRIGTAGGPIGSKTARRTSQKAGKTLLQRRVEPAMPPKGRRRSPSRRGYFDFFAASCATSRGSASSSCEEPNGLSKFGSGCFPRMSSSGPLSLSATPSALWSKVRSFGALRRKPALSGLAPINARLGLLHAALRFTWLSAIAVSFLSVAFSSSSVCCKSATQSLRPSSFAHEISVP